MPELVVKDGRSLRSASRIIGLTGIEEDLSTVVAMCRDARGLLGDDVNEAADLPGREFRVLQALFTTAIVTYSRCFVGGARTRLDESHVRSATGDLADEAIGAHRTYLLMRDKHVVHPVSPFEEGIVGIVIDGAPLRVVDIAPHLARQTLAPGTFWGLGNLAGFLKAHVRVLMEKAAVDAMAQANALTPEELAALPEAVFYPPTNDHLTARSGEARPLPDGGAEGFVLKSWRPDGDEDPLDPRLEPAGRYLLAYDGASHTGDMVPHPGDRETR